MATVTINGTIYTVYISVADAILYLQGSPSPSAALFVDADPDAQAKALVGGTRWLERQKWQGTKTDAGQALAWPRTGVVVDGTTIDTSTIPTAIPEACCEMAATLIADPEAPEEAGGTNTKRVKAGSAEVEFFRPQSGSNVPKVALELIADYLRGGGGRSVAGAAISFGTSNQPDTVFDDVPRFGTTR